MIAKHFRSTVLTIILCGLAGSAVAQPAPAQIGDAELESARGGFLVAGQVAFEFGAVTRTYAEGALALQTNVTWTANGAVVDHQSGVGLPASVDGALSVGGASIIHRITEGGIASVLTNTDSGRELSQQTDVTLMLPGFEQVQAGMTQSLLGARLAADIASSAALTQGR